GNINVAGTLTGNAISVSGAIYTSSTIQGVAGVYGNYASINGTIACNYLVSNYDISAAGVIVASNYVRGNGGVFFYGDNSYGAYVQPGGDRILNFAPSWYIRWGSATGTLQWVRGDGTAGWTSDGASAFFSVP